MHKTKISRLLRTPITVGFNRPTESCELARRLRRVLYSKLDRARRRFVPMPRAAVSSVHVEQDNGSLIWLTIIASVCTTARQARYATIAAIMFAWLYRDFAVAFVDF